MIIHTMEQGSPEWFAVKCGKVSASNISSVMAKGKGITRKNYMMRLLAERLSGIPQETYTNGAMQWGIDTEPLAREAFEADNLEVVEQVGFIEINDYLGCSPDGLIGDDCGVEIKCPNTATHLGYILDNKPVADYRDQIQGTLWMTGRKSWYLVSFDPRVPSRPLWQIRIERDEKRIKEIADEVEIFTSEMLELIEKIKKG